MGGISIVKKGKGNTDDKVTVKIGGDDDKPKKHSKISTNWWILDLGFANYNDKTNYPAGGGYLVNRPGFPAIDKNDFKLNNNCRRMKLSKS